MAKGLRLKDVALKRKMSCKKKKEHPTKMKNMLKAKILYFSSMQRIVKKIVQREKERGREREKRTVPVINVIY